MEEAGLLIFDALPYYDNDLEVHPILKQKVEQELAREAKPTQALHPLVPPEVSLFSENPLLQAELDRVASHKNLEALDVARYQLPEPDLSNTSEDEWKRSLKNAKAQLEHQVLRQSNLALLSAYGPNAWRIHNFLLEAAVQNTEKTSEDLTQKITDVNRQRKQAQIRLGNQLTTLETRWTELISNVLQIELANTALEAELSELRQRERDFRDL